MATERLDRKLAAILYADVAGYSRLTGEDEDATHRALSEYLDLISRTIEDHRGQVMHYAGDAVLAKFDAVVGALSAAVAIQNELKSRNQALPDQRKIQFRIGVNLGDVIEDRGDIYGDGVNVAARLESLAEPGGICISESVHTAVGNKLPIGYEFLGEQEVKNIEKPVRAYSAKLKPDAVLPAPSVRPRAQWPMHHVIAGTAAAVVLIITVGVITWLKPWAPEREPSSVETPRYKAPLAVLPFKNLTGDPEQERFADGLTEDLIADLANFPELFVIASNTVFTYKDKSLNVRDVGRELGVRYVLEGNVQKTDDMIRITAQLIDATDDKHLWAKRYDGPLADNFSVREEARWSMIATFLGENGILQRAERQRAIEKPPESRDAYDYVQLVHDQMAKYTKEATAEAKRWAEEAMALDPTYARAHNLLGWVHYREVGTGWGGDVDRSLELAFQHARKSWELDPADYWSHWLLGLLYLRQGQHDQAMAAYERARELNPNDADLLADVAWPLTLVGRTEEAIAAVNQAMRRKPNLPQYYIWTLGIAYRDAGQYQDALTTLKGLTEPNPRVHLTLASTYVRLGRVEEARAEVERYLEEHPDRTLKDLRFDPYKDPAQTARYLDDLRKAGLPEEPSLPLPDKPSIAVLPFTNMSDNPKQEYFVDGMTEDLITDLSKLSGLFVIARNSVFTYKGKAVKVRQVAGELGVRYVLEGSVRRADNQVRINAQLIDATTGGHVWAERYDGSLDNVFAMQDKVTQKIVAALAVKLTAREAEEVARRGTSNVAAYDAFLQGWAHYIQDTPDQFAKAIPYFNKAVELDPAYGRAYAALASVYYLARIRRWFRQLGLEHTESFRLAFENQDKAMRNPTPFAHAVASLIHLYQRRHDEAIIEAERAIALDPNDPNGYVRMGHALTMAGRPEEAIAFVEKAMRLDPHYPPTYLWVLGLAYFGMEQFDKAVTMLEKAFKQSSVLAGLTLAATYGHLDRKQEAEVVLQIEKKLIPPGYPYTARRAIKHYPFKDSADAERFADGLRKAGLE